MATIDDLPTDGTVQGPCGAGMRYWGMDPGCGCAGSKPRKICLPEGTTPTTAPPSSSVLPTGATVLVEYVFTLSDGTELVLAGTEVHRASTLCRRPGECQSRTIRRTVVEVDGATTVSEQPW